MEQKDCLKSSDIKTFKKQTSISKTPNPNQKVINNFTTKNILQNCYNL